jgi:hypothetical protein
VTCIDPTGTLAPAEAGALLTPYGTEIRPYRGVKYDDGTIEVSELGVFRLSKVTIKDDSSGAINIDIETFDLSRTVARDKFISPYVIAPGTNVITAIRDILDRTFQELNYDSVSTSLTTTAPRVYDIGDDPWESVTDLATSIGCEIYFSQTGDVVIAPSADIDDLPSPKFTYIEGDNCTMLDLSKTFTDEPGFNGVVVTGESPGDELPPVRAVAWDEEPTSVTYHLGPYGEVPLFYQDQIIKTTDDAQVAANQLLKSQLGFFSQIEITGVVNPAYEAGDVIQVVRERSHVSGLYVVDAFNIPLSADGTQRMTLRERRKIS